MAESTKVTLTVENPKLNIRYYVVAQPVFNPPFLNDDETSSSSSSSSSNPTLTVPAKQVRNTQPQCAVKSCSKFCKRGAKFCVKCDLKATEERLNIAMERANRN